MSSITQEININDILLDQHNPRHDIKETQRDLIFAMIDDQKDKLVKLANDIVASGVNPSDLPILIPCDDEPGKYIVVEGNRRIVALKLLHTPSQLPDSLTAIKQKFTKLHDIFVKKPNSFLNCVIFDDRESADHWISIKHTGENGGIGTVGWDSIAVNRYQAMKKKPSIQLQAVNFLIEYGNLEKSEQRSLKNMPITTVQRIVNDPELRMALGLHVENGYLTTNLQKDEVARCLYAFLLPFAVGEKNVTNVYHKKDRKELLENYDKDSLPDRNKRSESSWKLVSPPEPKVEKKTDQPKKNIKRSIPASTSRKYLIPGDCVLRIRVKRINDIYIELKSYINVDNCPNAAGVLMRVFLEVSANYYIDRHKLPKVNLDSKFHEKIKAIADHLESSGALTKPGFAGCRHGMVLFRKNSLVNTAS